jgi:hypothetical protein
MPSSLVLGFFFFAKITNFYFLYINTKCESSDSHGLQARAKPVRALVKSIGVNASALYIALFLFIYYSKNKEYCLD